ncbi:hypothetical protein L596_024316 [Steinernema carpocapsae]|uniref:Uncharacterized protein n=1 Tax=Steinernema carpocapsae TaxID=34508 RepID=A0A4U5MGD2_STECR|nr:hypothetical protein L596_024316 [Steinernema carpocapsae]
MPSKTVFFVIVASLATSGFCCAPGDGSLPSAQKTVKAIYLPPTSWTFPSANGTRKFDQVANEETATRRLSNDIKAAIFEAASKYMSSGYTMRIEKVESTIKEADLSGAVLRNENRTVAMVAGEYFTYETFVALVANLPLPQNQWEALATSVQLQLINEDFVEFNAPQCGLTVV